jgi:hypothetical protein
LMMGGEEPSSLIYSSPSPVSLNDTYSLLLLLILL